MEKQQQTTGSLNVPPHNVFIGVEPAYPICPRCGSPTRLVTTGPYGPFLSCSQYPKCKGKPNVCEVAGTSRLQVGDMTFESLPASWEVSVLEFPNIPMPELRSHVGLCAYVFDCAVRIDGIPSSDIEVQLILSHDLQLDLQLIDILRIFTSFAWIETNLESINWNESDARRIGDSLFKGLSPELEPLWRRAVDGISSSYVERYAMLEEERRAYSSGCLAELGSVDKKISELDNAITQAVAARERCRLLGQRDDLTAKWMDLNQRRQQDISRRRAAFMERESQFASLGEIRTHVAIESIRLLKILPRMAARLTGAELRLDPIPITPFMGLEPHDTNSHSEMIRVRKSSDQVMPAITFHPIPVTWEEVTVMRTKLPLRYQFHKNPYEGRKGLRVDCCLSIDGVVCEEFEFSVYMLQERESLLPFDDQEVGQGSEEIEEPILRGLPWNDESETTLTWNEEDADVVRQAIYSHLIELFRKPANELDDAIEFDSTLSVEDVELVREALSDRVLLFLQNQAPTEVDTSMASVMRITIHSVACWEIPKCW